MYYASVLGKYYSVSFVEKSDVISVIFVPLYIIFLGLYQVLVWAMKSPNRTIR